MGVVTQSQAQIPSLRPMGVVMGVVTQPQGQIPPPNILKIWKCPRTPIYYTTEVKLHVKSASLSTDNGQTSSIKTKSQNISITLLQISLKHRGRYWRKKLP